MTRQEIVDRLNTAVQEFKYTKVDGTERVARGTRNPDIVNEHYATPKGTGVEKEGVITYYDLDKEAWRSFREESFVEFL